jgi:hypothetical protein
VLWTDTLNTYLCTVNPSISIYKYEDDSTVQSSVFLCNSVVLPLLLHKQKGKQIPWPESASELYRPSYRRLSEKLVPTIADRVVSPSQRGGSLTAVISDF